MTSVFRPHPRSQSGCSPEALEPASPDLAITSHRWVAWACCSDALAAAAHRCPENYVESSTGIEGSVAAVVDVAARKTCSRRRPSTLWTGCSAAWQRWRGLMRARPARPCAIRSLAGSVVRMCTSFFAHHFCMSSSDFLALPLAQELLSFLETIYEVLRARIIHFHRHSERRKPRATTTTCNDVPSRGM